MAESPSSNTNAIMIRIIAQKTLKDFERERLAFFPNQSITVEDANALIDQLSVDIAADKIPANNKPRTPIGKYSVIKIVNSRSF